MNERPSREDRRFSRLERIALALIPLAIPAFIALWMVSPIAAIVVAALLGLAARVGDVTGLAKLTTRRDRRRT